MLAGLALAACGSPAFPSVAPRELGDVPSTAVVRSNASVDLPSSAPPVASAIDDLRIPSERVCLLKGEVVANTVLRLKPDGLEYAAVRKATKVRVHVTGDPVGTGLFIELDKGPLALAGVTPALDMAVYAKRPVTLGAIFLPRGDTDLRIAGAGKETLLLEATQTPFELRDLTTMLRNDVPCAGASLTATQIDARASLGKAIAQRGLVSKVVPLSLTANGEPVAMLTSSLSPVDILERTDGAARVVWQVEGGYVSGWVSETHLGVRSTRGEGRYGGIGHLRLARRGTSDRRMCSHDLPLGVSIGGDSRFIGRVRANTVIEMYGNRMETDELMEVAIPNDDIDILNDARLFARRSEIDACPRVPRLQ
jgi:hypothetical protein